MIAEKLVLTRTRGLPRILFFNVNGSGMGHLNRCLAYARRLRDKARPFFFSLASAIEIIDEMGFEADYFISHFWTCNSSYNWNCELAVRFGMMLERVQPDVVVFDGTWPFQGFMAACRAYGNPALVWSNRGLFKDATKPVPVDEAAFDLVIVPGELGAAYCEEAPGWSGRKIVVPPVTLLDEQELMDRAAARVALGMEADGRYVLFSLGPGNLKDVCGIGQGLIRRFNAAGFQAVWTRPPISVHDVELPVDVKPISMYPLVRYLRAFDVFVGAAGYNTCCEVVQACIPSLLVPNTQLVDDQARRACLVAQYAPAVISSCETEEEQEMAVARVLEMTTGSHTAASHVVLNGADLAVDAILALASRRGHT